MRVILVLLGLAALALAGALYLGLITVNQTPPGVVQTPAFQADVGRVTMGSQNASMTVPTIEVERAKQPGNSQ